MADNRALAVLFTRYGLAGVVNTLAGYAVILSCLYIGADDITANAAGFAFGLTISFTLNRSYVFGTQGRLSSGEVMRFLAAFAISYAVNLIVLWAARSALGAGNPLAQIPATVSYSLVMFVLSHRFVFSGRS